jgi:hypothetical protein
MIIRHKKQLKLRYKTLTLKKTVCCTYAGALQALIPYVKRLLQLFPEIKEKTKLGLPFDEVRNGLSV